MQTLHFCAFLRADKAMSESGYIFSTDTGDLLDISAGILPLLGIGQEEMKVDRNISSWVGEE